MSGYNANKEHGPHSTSGTAASPKYLSESQALGFRLRQSGLKTQTAIQLKHIPRPNRESHVLREHYSLVCPCQGLQIDSKLVSVNG
jgi:hypothetical protein